MKHCMTYLGVLLFAGMLASCGGGGGDGSDSTSGGSTAVPNNGAAPATPPTGGTPTPPPTSGTPTPPPPPPTTRFEESDPAVILSGVWAPATSRGGWSGGSAMQSAAPGATASFTFTGTSVRWIGRRGKESAIARVSVDGRDPIEVDLYSEPNEIRTSIITLYDLGEGPHTLTIEVTGTWNAKAAGTVDTPTPVVTVDAFEVEPQIVSRFQEMDPDVTLTGSWIQDSSGTWSGGGVASGPDPRFGGMRYTNTLGDKATVKFRGTAIAWNGYRGPDGGIAIVRIDGGEPKEVDTYSSKFKAQEEVFKATGLTNKTHTMTIEMTDRRNPAAISIATGPVRIVVDSFEVTRPGRRYQERDPAITYVGPWHRDNDNRPWSEGRVFTSELPGTSVTFTFTGTSVAWIGAQKRSIGRSRIILDNQPPREINNKRIEPIEGYQREIIVLDKLSPGQHTLRIEPVSGGYTVVDAFDVHPAEPAEVTTATPTPTATPAPQPSK